MVSARSWNVLHTPGQSGETSRQREEFRFLAVNRPLVHGHRRGRGLSGNKAEMQN